MAELCIALVLFALVGGSIWGYICYKVDQKREKH